MASAKQKPVDSARRKINDKVAEIKDISTRLHNTINSAVNKPLESGTSLLSEKSNKKFLNGYTKVNQELEACLCQLLLLETALTPDGEAGDDNDETSEDDDDEDDDGNNHKSKDEITLASGFQDRNSNPVDVKFPEVDGVDNEEEEEMEEIDARQITFSSQVPSMTDSFAIEIDATCIDPTSEQYNAMIDKLKDDCICDENNTTEVEKCDSAEKNYKSDVTEYGGEHTIEEIKDRPAELSSLDDLITVIDSKSEFYNQQLKSAVDDTEDSLTNRNDRPSISSSSKASSRITTKKIYSKPLKKGLVLQPCPIEFGKQYAAIVGDILSPSRLYIQIINDDYNQFMEELCIEFAKDAATGYRGGVAEVPSVGQTCCAKSPIDDTWYRAIITDVHHESAKEEEVRLAQARHEQAGSVASSENSQLNLATVDVLFVDQGSFAQSLPLSMLRPLPDTILSQAALPRQALCCALAGIQPVGCEFNADDISMGVIHRQWNGEATQWLNDLLQSEDILKAVFTSVPSVSTEGTDAIFVDLYLCDMADPSAGLCDELNVALMMKQVDMAVTYPTVSRDDYNNQQMVEERSVPVEEDSVDSKEKNNDCTSPIGASYEWMRTLLCNGRSIKSFTFTSNYHLKDWSHLSRDFGKVVVSHVIDPSLFYVHLLTVDLIDFDSFVDRLNAFYDEQGSRAVDEDGLCIQEGSSVVAKCTEDKRWCRGIVTSIKRATRARRNTRSCRVLFVDYGTEEWLPEDSLLPLQECFFDFPIQTSPCSLADVVPCSHESESDDSNSMYRSIGKAADDPRSKSNWPQAAIDKFENMVLTGKPLVVSLKENASDDIITPTNVYMYDTSDEKEVCINQLLVDCGLASSKVLTKLTLPPIRNQDEPSQSDASVSSPSNDGKWDPMKAEYESERNRYNLNVDDASIAAGSMVLSNKKICRFYATRQGCYRGADCPFDHCRPDEIPVHEVEVFCTTTVSGVDLPDTGTWVAVTVTSFFDISHFWVQFPLGTQPLQNIIFKGVPDDDNSKELDLLHSAMRSAYEGKRFENNTGVALPALGELLAARFSKDGQWYRARVIDITSESEYKVFFIDYGNCETVKAADTRLLLRDFVHLDAQAVECFLAGIEPVNNQSMVSTKARKRFEELTTDKVLVGRIKARYPNSVLFLELFETNDDTSINIAHVLADEGHVTLTKDTSAASSQEKIT